MWFTDTHHPHTHTPEYYSAIKKNEILPFVTAWMDLEHTTLSEISQTEKDKNWGSPGGSVVETPRFLPSRNRDVDGENKCMDTKGERGGVGGTGTDTYTLLILSTKQTTDGNILYSTGNST